MRGIRLKLRHGVMKQSEQEAEALLEPAEQKTCLNFFS